MSQSQVTPSENQITPHETARRLSKALGGVAIIQKGISDIITDGKNILECDEPGTPRRCGGQGDLLAGSLATFLAWSNQTQRISTTTTNNKDDISSLCSSKDPNLKLSTSTFSSNSTPPPSSQSSSSSIEYPLLLRACYGACFTVLRTANLTYQKLGRSMLASDMVHQIGAALSELEN